MIWLEFIACTAVIVFSGAKLSKYGDIIAGITGLGRTWIGVVLMATVTSMPELITGVASVTLNDVPNIAVGDALGSCMFNIAIIAMLDFLDEKPVTSEANPRLAIHAAFGIAMLSIVTIGLVSKTRLPSLGQIGLSSFLSLALYFIAMRIVFGERHSESESNEDSAPPEISKTRAFTVFGLHAAVVIAAASWLPSIGKEIAKTTGLGETFVGSLFIGLSTSLPEFVVTYTALKNRAVDMAVGNLLGSNLFNIAVLAIDDVCHRSGPLLASVNQYHAITACAAILLTAFSIVGITFRSEKKILHFSPDSIAIVVVFLAATFLLYSVRNGS